MYDENKAKRVIKFINQLKHTKGIWHGVPFDLLDWQEKIIKDIFGTIKEDGYRKYNTAYIEIPKKNGKSEIAAAIALYLTCGDSEWGAEVYGCAADKQQASIVFDVAVEMVEQCPALKKRIKPIMSRKRLVYIPTGSFYQVLSAEAYTKHGLNVHGVIFDELHAQTNRQLYDVMTKGSGDARKQPLFFLITTAGNDRNSICYEVHQKAEDILKGKKNDPTFYPVIYGINEADDWSDESNWYKANPSLGHTIEIDKVRASFISATENPAEENLFRQLRLNQWVKQSIRWMPMDTWNKCDFEVNQEELIGIEKFIEDLGDKYNIKEIAFDRWNATQMAQNLEDLGFTVIPFGQGFKFMAQPTKRLMELTLQKKIAHGGNPVLAWMMDNIHVRTDPAGNIKPDKERSTEKIDGAVAMIMALDRTIRNEGCPGSVYDERGVLFI